MVASSGGPQLPFVNLFAASAVSACTAEVRGFAGSGLACCCCCSRIGCASDVGARTSSLNSMGVCAYPPVLLQAMTLPLDTAKVKLQLQGAGGGKYK